VQRDSWILVDKGRIVAIQKEKPAAATTLATSDYVFPGFVDLHNHPMYNILPRWRPPHTYANRYEWRGDPIYRAAMAPQADALKASFCDVDAYVELKMLMGGTTSTIGISKPSAMPTMDACIAGLARNLDWHTGFHGAAPGNEPVLNLIGITSGDMRDVKPADIAAKLKKGELELLAIHIAEGRLRMRRREASSGCSKRAGLVTNRTAVIHGIALTDAEYAKMAAAGAGARLVPAQQHGPLRRDRGCRRGIAQQGAHCDRPDWGPTGSDNILDELSFASSLSRTRLGGAISNRQLFEMATRIPAEIARVDKEVGSLVPGLRADLFLLKSPNPDAYTALVQTGASGIGLVLVEGVPVYGDAAYMKAWLPARPRP
jgi:cytosine/adenosine deaminase-related metal-dependent hydrolase